LEEQVFHLTRTFETIGIEPVGNTPDEAGKFLSEEIAKWAKVISTAGVKPEQ